MRRRRGLPRGPDRRDVRYRPRADKDEIRWFTAFSRFHFYDRVSEETIACSGVNRHLRCHHAIAFVCG